MNYLKRKAEISKNLEYWEAKAKKKQRKFYIYYLFFLVAFAYIIDEIASNINGLMQTQVINEFFKGDDGFSKYVIVTTLCTGVSIFSFLYRGLADKYGRKLFLFINTIGFGVGMFICFISKVLPLYLIGLITISFFAPCDIQVLYVIEISPSKHRGLFLTLGKALGVLGVSLVSLLRNFASQNGWQFVFLVPSIVAVVIGILIFFFIDETDVFLKNKITNIKNEMKFVENPASEYAKQIKKKKNNIGFVEAIKYTIKSKELLWLFLVGVVISIVSIGISYYPSIMQPTTNAGLSDDQVTKALFIYPFAFSIIEVSMGLLTDKIGRRSSILLSGLTALMGFLLFVVSVKMIYNPYIIGLFLGLFLGGYFAIIDIFNIVCSECSPTNIRASILSVLSISLSVGSFFATIVLLLARLINQKLDLAFFCLILIVPSLFFALLIILTKIPETKNKAELQIEKIVKIENSNNKDKKIKENKNGKSRKH